MNVTTLLSVDGPLLMLTPVVVTKELADSALGAETSIIVIIRNMLIAVRAIRFTFFASSELLHLLQNRAFCA
jgi:hypothetical protein